MYKSLILFAILTGLLAGACAQPKQKEKKGYSTELPAVIADPAQYNQLEPKEKYVILEKGTEWAFSGEYHDLKAHGTYLCRQCNQPLFLSTAKFDSGTGWPSFDDFIEGSVTELTDADGRRTEIVCSNCDGHLGHVFRGERFTPKSTRHCVNSVSLQFVAEEGKKRENENENEK